MDLFADRAPAGAPIVDASILAAARADHAGAPSSTTTSSPGARVPIAPAGVDHAAAAVALVEFAAVALFPLSPSLEAVYPIETRTAIAQALGPVLKKYDIDLNALPPELVLACVIVPTLPAAIAAIRADRAARLKGIPDEKTQAQEKVPDGEVARERRPYAGAGPSLNKIFPGLARTD